MWRGRENSAAIQIYYEDHGQGAPVVLVHGFLLDGHSWEKQEMALLAAGYRVITYDRRGFGASSRPSVGYNYDTLTADLATLLDQLDLREVVLAGFCAGTGEVTRYLGTYGHGRVRAAVLLAPLPPFLPRAGDNPGGVDRGVLSAFITRIGADRPAATKTFLDRSYNLDLLGGVRVSDQACTISVIVIFRIGFADDPKGPTPFRLTINVYPADTNQFVINSGEVGEVFANPIAFMASSAESDDSLIRQQPQTPARSKARQ